MTGERWARIKQLFFAAADLPPGERTDWLRRECLGDEALHAEVRSLLDAPGTADFLEREALPHIDELLARLEPDRAGSRLGAWRLLREIGRGGMGRVYEAERADGQFEQRTAIKILRTGAATRDVLTRFLAERQILASLNHEGIARMFDGGLTPDGLPYFVMEHVEGVPLDRFCAEHSLPLRERLRLFRRIALAVHHAHQHLVVHRDLKPSNILVTAAGAPKLLDFGIAKLLGAGGASTGGETVLRAMTPAYASPEQVRGEPISVASDVYALGVILYELLAERRPYPVPPTEAALARAITEIEPSRPSAVAADVTVRSHLRGDLDAIVLKALRKEPGERYGSAQAFADDIARWLDGDAVQARPIGLPSRLWRRARRRPAASLGAAAALLIVLALGWLWLGERRAAADAQRFGEDAQRIRTTVRLAEMLPLHDLRSAKRAAREQMRALEAALERRSGRARAGALLALGQGHLALHEPREARRRLEEAGALGLRSPDLSYALGLALARLYQEAVRDLRGVTDAELRAERLAALDRDLRGPAIDRLRGAPADAQVAPAYVEGLLALVEQRDDDAVRLAGRARATVPWLYEASILEGDAHAAAAIRHRSAGNAEAAATRFEEASSAYGGALRVAGSAGHAWERLCTLWTDALELEIFQRATDVDTLVSRGTEACDSAMAVDPDRAAPYSIKAGLLHLLARHQLQQGGDAPATLAQVAALAEEAIRREPDRAAHHRELGRAHAVLAEHQLAVGVDPSAASARAVAALRRALELDPGSARTHIALGLALWNVGWYERTHGRDPRASLQQAIEAYRRAFELSPALHYVSGNLGGVYLDLGRYEVASGGDPTASYAEAIRTFERGLAANPNDVGSLNNLGNAWNELANYQFSRGEDPATAIDRAIAQYDATLKVSPGLYFALSNMGHTLILRGEQQLRQGGDPSEALARAEHVLRQAAEANPARWAPHEALARIARLDAARRLARGEPIDPLIERGLSHIREALARNPGAASAHAEAATLWLTRARAMAAAGRPTAAPLRQARAAANRALDINPNLADARAVLEEAGRLAPSERKG
jgi:serine/threonine-protein kinase